MTYTTPSPVTAAPPNFGVSNLREFFDNMKSMRSFAIGHRAGYKAYTGTLSNATWSPVISQYNVMPGSPGENTTFVVGLKAVLTLTGGATATTVKFRGKDSAGDAAAVRGPMNDVPLDVAVLGVSGTRMVDVMFYMTYYGSNPGFIAEFQADTVTGLTYVGTMWETWTLPSLGP